MTLPLVVLAVLSAVGGWVGIPHVIGAILPGHPPNLLEHWLEPAITAVKIQDPSALLEWSLMGISVGLAGTFAWLAYDFYILHPERPKKLAESFSQIYKLVLNKYYVDEVYSSKIIQPLVKVSRYCWYYIDVNFVDKTTYFLSDLIKNSGAGVKTFQNGNLQQYALYVTLGLVAMMTYVLVG
jgi:NADH-quinone oxidoreductase subunit L